ncbi:uncharacterized protein [Rutidosis leptorrhynchoides]|uniref:uncharacterized protein n=1 Tax=Rutidosis leptorrhynchoides TaxID=125765 RepID=UPI003A9A5C3D
MVHTVEQVIIFCEKHKVNMPDFKAPYKSTRYRPRGQDNQVNVEHFYKVDIFICTLDKKLNEMASRFDDHAMELLTLTSALGPKRISELKGTATIGELCKILVETHKCEVYSMLDRVFRLILTLLVSTATTERALSAMKLCKTRLCNKMSNDFLADNLVVYIEKDIVESFDS